MSELRRPSRRLSWLFPAGVLAAVAAGVVLVVVAGTLIARGDVDLPGRSSGGTCNRTVRVVTSSSFTSVLNELIEPLRRAESCVNLDVTTVDGRAAAERVARIDADVWIPDDASWAGVAGATKLANTGTANSGAVLATSPLYMVADSATAQRLRQAGGSWLALANLLIADRSGVKLAVRDPGSSGDGMVAAAAVGEAVWIDQGMDASSLALAKLLPATRTVGGPLALPAIGGEVGVVPEYALLPALDRLDRSTVLLPGTDHTAMLRFTWLPTADAVANPARASALTPVLQAINGPIGAKAIGAARLRLPETTGSPAAGPPVAAPPPGAPVDRLPKHTATAFDVFGRHHVEHVFATWYPQDRRVSLLVVVDVSGSMNSIVAGTGLPVIELVKRGCRSVGDLLPDDAYLGLWTFGIALDPPRDHRTVVPVGRLDGERREMFASAVRGLAAASNGTGLYDTILASYLAARDAYRPGMPNQVLIFSDGDNDDPNTITSAQLTARLAEAADPARPVQLSVAVFSKKATADSIRAILKPIAGYVDAPSTSDEVAAIFIHVAAGGLHT